MSQTNISSCHFPVVYPTLTTPENDLLDFKKEILDNFHPTIVEKILKQIKHRSHLNDDEKARIKYYCSFLTYDNQIKEEAKSSCFLKRIMSQYLGTAQKINYYNLKENIALFENGTMNLELFFQNALLFKEYILEIEKKYGEEVCHRILISEEIMPNTIFTGSQSLENSSSFFQKIDQHYIEELSIETLIESHSKEKLTQEVDQILLRIESLNFKPVKDKLKRELALKVERYDLLIPKFKKEHIENLARLFYNSSNGLKWAQDQEKLKAFDNNNINQVFFLKGISEDKNTSVFKYGKANCFSAGMEALVYDAAAIFNIEESLVPTKLAKLNAKEGSIQTFQDGLLWQDLEKLTKDTQKEIINKISLRDFIFSGLPTLVFANRDFHSLNMIIVKKPSGGYTVKGFDNEYCFMPTNYAFSARPLKKCSPDKVHHFLPMRNALLIFPQADEPIKGELKEELKNLALSWREKYKEFNKYLSSPLGITRVSKIEGNKFNKNQMNAFKERLEKVIPLLISSKDYTYRDLIYRLYPLYSSYNNLTKLFEPVNTEIVTGSESAQDLCQRALYKEATSTEVTLAFKALTEKNQTTAYNDAKNFYQQLKDDENQKVIQGQKKYQEAKDVFLITKEALDDFYNESLNYERFSIIEANLLLKAIETKEAEDVNFAKKEYEQAILNEETALINAQKNLEQSQLHAVNKKEKSLQIAEAALKRGFSSDEEVQQISLDAESRLEKALIDAKEAYKKDVSKSKKMTSKALDKVHKMQTKEKISLQEAQKFCDKVKLRGTLNPELATKFYNSENQIATNNKEKARYDYDRILEHELFAKEAAKELCHKTQNKILSSKEIISDLKEITLKKNIFDIRAVSLFYAPFLTKPHMNKEDISRLLQKAEERNYLSTQESREKLKYFLERMLIDSNDTQFLYEEAKQKEHFMKEKVKQFLDYVTKNADH